MIRFGLVGVNTSHANVFTGIFNGGKDNPPALEGAQVVAVWGEQRDERQELVDRYGIKLVVEDPSQMVGAIDAVLIEDDTGGGATHARLARPFLEAAIPTFIDKPMTLDIGEASELFDLAEQHSTPLMSSSALRYAVELETLRNQLADLGSISSIVSVGPGEWHYYGVHAVEMYQTVAGLGARWVHRHVFDERDIVVVGYDEGPSVVVETLRDAVYTFHLSVYGANGCAQCKVTDSKAFYTRLMSAVLDMVVTGKPPITRSQTMEVLGVLHAGIRSAESESRVQIADVLPSATLHDV